MNLLRSLFYIMLGAALSGCSQIINEEFKYVHDTVQSQIQPSNIDDYYLNVGLSKPTVKIGDRFQFSQPPVYLPPSVNQENGQTVTAGGMVDQPDEVWTVASIIKPYIIWHNSVGDERKTSFNPFIPALNWTGSAAGRRTVYNVEGHLFPLKKGKTMSFSVDGLSGAPASGWRSTWECVVDGSYKITVQDDEEDTQLVSCKNNHGTQINHFYSGKYGVVVYAEVAESFSNTNRVLVSSSKQ